jgi:hypothetical protein
VKSAAVSGRPDEKKPEPETMHNHNAGSDPKNPPARGGKNNLLTSWAAIVALLGAGAVPCPECGMPLAWHLWPLAILLLAARLIARRKPALPPKTPAPPDESEKPRNVD